MKSVKEGSIFEQKQNMSLPLLWSHKITEVNDGGLKKSRTANDEERSALAKILDLLECVSLEVNYFIEPLASGWRVSGDIKAHITQSCIISLEPVESTITETFKVEFRKISPPLIEMQEDHDILEAEDVEHLEDDQINVGRIIYETLSSAINPYPRKKGAQFMWQDPQLKMASKTVSPFEVLKKLKYED